MQVNSPDPVSKENDDVPAKNGIWTKPLTHLPALIRNKYFISFTGFIVIMLFLDKNDLFTQYGRHKELKELQASKRYYSLQIASERKELEQLKRDPGTLEKYAREKYLMKRDEEDLFLVPEEGEKPKK